MAPGGEAVAPGGEAMAPEGESAGTGVPYGMLEVETPLETLAPPRAEEGASMETLTPGLPEKREARWISTGSSDMGSSGPTESVPSPMSSCEASSSSHATATIFADPVDGGEGLLGQRGPQCPFLPQWGQAESGGFSPAAILSSTVRYGLRS